MQLHINSQVANYQPQWRRYMSKPSGFTSSDSPVFGLLSEKTAVWNVKI